MKLKSFKKWFQAGVISLGIVVIIRYFMLIPITVEGDSMQPALQPGFRVVIEPFTTIRRFDIILFHDEDGEAYIKRVIGLPGEKLSYQNNHLFINDKRIAEATNHKNFLDSSVMVTSDFDLETLTGLEVIPEGTYFVLGDNRSRSKDSRMFGVVSQDSIEGKARFVFFPFTEMKPIH